MRERAGGYASSKARWAYHGDMNSVQLIRKAANGDAQDLLIVVFVAAEKEGRCAANKQ